MKRMISSNTNVDFSEEVAIGKECVKYLQSRYSELRGRVTYRRSKAWSEYMYIVFTIESEEAIELSETESIEEQLDRNKIYNDDIHADSRFYNDFVQCSIDTFSPDNRWRYPEVTVFCLTKRR